MDRIAVIARFEHKRGRLLALVVTLCLLSATLDSGQRAARHEGSRTWLDNTVCAAASPFQGLLSAATAALTRAAAQLQHTRRLTGENAALRTRTADLESRITALEEEQGRSARTRDLRSATAAFAPQARAANVIGWGEGSWTSYLLLDRGETAGVRAKDVALAKQGVIGQVYAVSATTARVLPITDPSSGVAALVKRSRETGVLVGVGEGRCELRYLDPDADVRAGDVALTSGTGGIFPKGLLLGTVETVRNARGAPGRVATVRPAAEMWKVEEAAIVSQVKRQK